MGNSPFSVAMSVYERDNAVHFERALESITSRQSIMPDEIVLIADGPLNDSLNKVIADHESKYDALKVVRLEKNVGLGNALKIAVENCTYELIARMDSDDVATEDRFEQQLKYFDTHSETDIVGGDITEFINDESNIVGMRCVPCSNDEIRDYMKKRCPFNHMTVMYKKSAVMKAGGYLDWFWNEDYYLWIRMMLAGASFSNTGTVLVNVRVGADMYKRRGGLKYFKSEEKLQKYMLDHRIISVATYITNVAKRFILQLMLPNSLRGWIFKKFARKNAS